MTGNNTPTFSVEELNFSIATLIDRAFPPQFFLSATVSKVQLKRGHLWLTLTDGDASIDAVVWSSRLKNIQFKPKLDDGVLILGKLNFWKSQARISVQIYDIKPTVSTVLRDFERVKLILSDEGLLDAERRRPLPRYPKSIGILTSVPSSALADILRTAKEKWPLTKLFIIPIPVQGNNHTLVLLTLNKLSLIYKKLNIDAIVIARGGGSREDLMLFDNEQIAREIASFPIPVVTGIGHEDDLTIADLVSDYRAATPTASIVELLPSKSLAKSQILQKRQRIRDCCQYSVRTKALNLSDRRKQFKIELPSLIIQKKHERLDHLKQLLDAFSPLKWLKRGFAIVRDEKGQLLHSAIDIKEKDIVKIEFIDGELSSKVENIELRDY